MEKHLSFIKIPLLELIETLDDIYASGADYIDIIEERKGFITIHIKGEYMKIDNELTEEDIIQLTQL